MPGGTDVKDTEKIVEESLKLLREACWAIHAVSSIHASVRVVACRVFFFFLRTRPTRLETRTKEPHVRASFLHTITRKVNAVHVSNATDYVANP